MKVKIGSHCSLKINTGNFESLDIGKTIEVEIEVASPADLPAKSGKISASLVEMLKNEAEATMHSLGRNRYNGMVQSKIDLWQEVLK